MIGLFISTLFQGGLVIFATLVYYTYNEFTMPDNF